jgi:hypothetical protein
MSMAQAMPAAGIITIRTVARPSGSVGRDAMPAAVAALLQARPVGRGIRAWESAPVPECRQARHAGIGGV